MISNILLHINMEYCFNTCNKTITVKGENDFIKPFTD